MIETRAYKDPQILITSNTVEIKIQYGNSQPILIAHGSPTELDQLETKYNLIPLPAKGK